MIAASRHPELQPETQEPGMRQSAPLTSKPTDKIETLYNAALAAAFTAWRRVLSPVFAGSGLGHCRYLPSCSEYAHVALARHGPIRGARLAAARLLRCHPWAAGGLDPVPAALDTIPSDTALAPPVHKFRR